MHSAFSLDSSNTNLWDNDMLDIDLDMLDTDIPSQPFVCLQDILNTNKYLLGKLGKL